MKKLLMGSIALTLFSISILIFQISCQKELVAQQNTTNYILPPATTTTLGGVIIGSGLSITSNGTLSVNASTGSGLTQLNKIVFKKFFVSGIIETQEIWTANYDGTNSNKVNLTLPATLVLNDENGTRLSPDGQLIFFTVKELATGLNHIYSCKIDGSNLKKVIDGAGTKYIETGGAY